MEGERELRRVSMTRLGCLAAVSRTACLDAELHLRLLVRPRGKVVVLAQEVVIVCLCLKDTEIHAASKQGNTTNSALESLHSLQWIQHIALFIIEYIPLVLLIP